MFFFDMGLRIKKSKISRVDMYSESIENLYMFSWTYSKLAKIKTTFFY